MEARYIPDVDHKIKLTQQLIAQLEGPDQPDFENAMMAWWQDWRTDSGLRLTTEGRDLLDLLEYESYRFEIPMIIAVVPRNLLILDKKLTCPYHIQLGKKPRLTLYGSKEATLFALFNDPDKFMALLAQS